ncbi:hypothetical protein KTN05_17130 [Paracoccus sp. Z118]|uniref:hypothetical protein n=1 Tax=Paracoccus sp. Z118 TaxID=2851017 RepID=UPI001C2BC172|nr:hypothetical protein [Paracoccus sp. Z118]MBV0893513.1 hypothetical protein [Paracoccus sp. Z118]
MELSLPENHACIRGLADGAPLMMQHEMSKPDPGRAIIHRIRPRPGGTVMDVAPEQIGVINHVNHQKSLIHVVVERGVDGTCPISRYAGEAKVGDAVAVRLARHHGKTRMHTRIIAILPTDRSPAPDVCRTFREATNVTESGLGFTLGDIFIPPHMIAAADIESGDLVEGVAVTSFDKKRGKCGMKAIRAKSVARNHHNFGRVGQEDHDDDW